MSKNVEDPYAAFKQLRGIYIFITIASPVHNVAPLRRSKDSDHWDPVVFTKDMDPFTAIALAGNILQFVAFAKDCYVQVKQLQESPEGMTKTNIDNLEHTERADVFLGSVAAGTAALGDGSHGTLTSTEKYMQDAGNECQRLASELRDDLNARAVKPRSGVFRSTANVLAGTWKLSHVQQKLNSLDKLQTHLYQLLLAHVGERQSRLILAIAKIEDEHRELDMARANDLLEAKTEILGVLRQMLTLNPTDNSAKHMGDSDKERGESEKQTHGGDKQTDDSVEQVASMLIDWAARADSLRKETTLLRSLRFEGMLNRLEDIPDAEPRTFQWVNKPAICFQDWLSKDDGAYWVTGQPGSGKSTLMKYLSHHQETQRCLGYWADGNNLVTAKYFFWYTGGILQRSQEGLLRSLLFEILRQCPSLIPEVCASRWTSDMTIPWTRRELMNSINSLTLASTSTKFFFLIDGLDEYQGEQDNPSTSEDGVAPHIAEIIEVMRMLSSLKNVKLCLSSRPWLAFEKAFGQVAQRKLYVHRENRDDIRLYIRTRLEQRADFTMAANNQKELGSLVDDMVKDSQGVFLWVFLAIESLLRGLSNEDRIGELRRRLDLLPKRLETMFERMLGTVEGLYQEQAAKILQIALHAKEPLCVAVYSRVGDDDMETTPSEPSSWSAEECVEMSKSAANRLKVRCPDLIRVRGTATEMTSAQAMRDHRVEFLHRTVRDFLALAETQTMLRQRLKKPFDAAAFVARALLIQITGARMVVSRGYSSSVTSKHNPRIDQLLDDFANYTAELEQRERAPQTILLGQMEHILTQQTRDPGFLIGNRSFVTMMAQKGMPLYVQTKLPQALAGPGMPMLESVLLSPGDQFQAIAKFDNVFCDSLEMVKLLLKNGAKPNQLVFDKSITIWDKYIRHLKANNMDASCRRRQIQIVQSLLEHGADPNLRYFLRYVPTAKATFSRPVIRERAEYEDLLSILSDVFGADKGYAELLIHEGRKDAGFFSGGWMPSWLSSIT